ncbi:MAG: hypothetical protein ACJ8AD_18735, partial [Gemmatimonadaceae bacterium]
RLQYARAPDTRAIPTFSVDGLVMCMPDFAPSVVDVNCLVRAPGATVRIGHPGTTRGEIAGNLAVERWDEPQRSLASPSPHP